MTFRNALIIVSCLLVIGGGRAGAATISGIVKDSESEKPVPFATVQIEGTGRGGYADSTGHFVVENVPAGEHVIIVSSIRHRGFRIRVSTSSVGDHWIEAQLTPSAVEAGSIVVTGTRTPRYVKDAPVFTEVISRTAIEDKSAQNIFEALEGVSGVRVEQQCQNCNFTMLRMQGLGADHTQVLLDGQPVYSGLAGVYGLQQMSTAEVSQIEIVKGAGSALYGSNAVAGAINIVSSEPKQTGMELGIEVGEHGTNRYDFMSSTRKGDLGLLIFAQQSDQDELDETGDINSPGGVDNPDGWIDRVKSSTRNLGANLFLDDVFASDQLILRGRVLSETRKGGRLTADQFLNPFAPGTEHIATSRFSGQLEYRFWSPGGTELNASLALTEHQRDATNDTFLGDYEETYGRMPPVDLLRPYTADERLIVANVNVMHPVGSRHRLLAGLQFAHNNLREGGMYLDAKTEEPYTSTADKTSSEIGGYIQDEVRLRSNLELVAGLRIDYHKSQDKFRGSGDVLAEGLDPLEYEETAVNPRFSIKYAISESITLRGSVGSGFRVPYGFSEDLHLCSGSPRVYKGGELQPEKSLSYSLTADYADPGLSASLGVYRTELRDAIAFADADPEVAELGYTYQWQNVDDAYVMGAEFNGSYALSRRLVISARAELFRGQYLNPRPDWAGTAFEEESRHISRFPASSAGLKVEYSAGKWNAVADADYKGKMYIDLAEPSDPALVQIHETDPYVTVSTRISRRLSDQLEVYAGARNLSNYTQKEKHVDDAAFVYAPVYGRIVYGGIRVKI